MKEKRIVWFSSFFLIMGLSTTMVYAQATSKARPSDLLTTDDLWTQSLANLKKSMNEILQKNDVLASENNVLRKKVLDLQEDLKRLEGEKEKSSQEPIRLNDLLKEKSQGVATLQKNIEDLKEKISQLQKDKKSLGEEILTREERQKTFDSQLNDLKGQITELTKEIKATTEESQRLLKSFDDEKRKLNQSLEESKVRQSKAEKELEELKTHPLTEESRAKTLNEEQGHLKEELAKVREELQATIDEKQKLQDENLKLQQEGRGNLNPSTQEVEQLRARNKELENTLKESKRKFGSTQKAISLSAKDEKNLDGKIASLQQENNSLKEKISAHMEEIVRLNREKAMTESLLTLQTKASKKRSSPPEGAAKGDHQLLGYQYAASGQYEKAIEEYKLALKVDPSKKDIYYNLGFIYARLGQFDDAIANYKEVLKLDPNDKETNYNLSQIYKELSDTKTSQEYYNRYLKLQDK